MIGCFCVILLIKDRKKVDIRFRIYCNLFSQKINIKKSKAKFRNNDKFLKKRAIPDKRAIFQHVSQLGNVYFSLPDKLQKGNVYIITDSYLNEYKTKKFIKKKFGNYVVIYKNVNFK